MELRTSFVASFSRSQASAAIGTAVDFTLLFFLVEYLGVWYVAATAIGAIAGGATNFYMNRSWSFGATHRHWHLQALRYALTSGTSLALNVAGTYLLTDFMKVHYALSAALVSLSVGLGFNFPMHRYFVFR